MTRSILVSLPVADLGVSSAFYAALGFERDARFSDASAARMAWSDAIAVMLVTDARWRTLTQRPRPAAGTAGHMLSLSMATRDAVDAMSRAAAANGGRADVNPAEDHGFMYARDLADPDGHAWAAVWVDPAAFGAGRGG
jgi:predicted lactoylglutathione lyase